MCLHYAIPYGLYFVCLNDFSKFCELAFFLDSLLFRPALIRLSGTPLSKGRAMSRTARSQAKRCLGTMLSKAEQCPGQR